jgi:autotransporter strand-loop-strand O-heptosyltransferase
MKITNVTPGLIPIPPNGWGAVEKIIWEQHRIFSQYGIVSEVKYLDEVTEPEIVHIHVANLANEAHRRGIKYYFTLHDHHAYLYGKESEVYKENLQAMKNAVKAFVPAKYLVNYFDNIPEYFSHGVDVNYFTARTSPIKSHKLLCVANNGYAHDQTIDRKGFGIAIEVAKRWGLPITIAGPSNNKKYFEKYPPSYDKLTILYDLSEDELLNVYHDHTIFLHPSELEAGHPNLTILEALSCGLPVVGTLEKETVLNGVVSVAANVDEIVYGLQSVLNNYANFSSAARQQAIELSWENRCKDLLDIYQSKSVSSMTKEMVLHYTNTLASRIPIRSPDIEIKIDNKEGLRLDIQGGPRTKYHVDFIDKKRNVIVYSAELATEFWAKPYPKYYIDWKIKIKDLNSTVTYEFDLDLTDKLVYIALESSSLGDTLAWFPYVEEFRKLHNCKVICSTFWNRLFETENPNITFVAPGTIVDEVYAHYRVGLYYTDTDNIDLTLHPRYPLNNRLQKIATDILGLEYKEIRPKIKYKPVEIDEKQICIAIHGTCQAKYWNNPTGWQEVVDWLLSKGYTVKLLSNENDGHMGNHHPSGVIKHQSGDIEDVISEIKKSKLFIGIGSGLSWLSWAVNTQVVLISGFSDPISEMEECVRISAPSYACHGCFNRSRLDPSNWNWCPDLNWSNRIFECSKTITADTVIKELKKIIGEL